MGLRDGVGPLHLRHPGAPQGARSRAVATSSAPRTRSSTAPASTPTAACSRPCSAPRTRSSPTSSTTPASSTASGCPRPSATATRTATWPTWRRSSRTPPTPGCRLIATDGVFSMDGYVAPLDEICDLAERYDALVMVDDSHAVGFVGPTARGTPEQFGVTDRVDIITGTLGKALGGASGGYVAGARGDRRAAAPALAAVPVLQLRRPVHRRRLAGACSTSTVRRPRLRDKLAAHRAFPRRDDRGRLRHPARRPPDRPR